ncbi:MAG: hypothetical protein IMX00_09940 [Limnochordales bacterium]|nr:hypothetical protein [Limnochordales bacterium]
MKSGRLSLLHRSHKAESQKENETAVGSASPWRRGLRWLLLALLALLVYMFFPRFVLLELISTANSPVAARQDFPSWKMAATPEEEAFDDYGIPVPEDVDFGKVNVVVSHGRPLRFITWTPFSRLVSRYRYWINLPLGHPWYAGKFERGKVYIYKTSTKQYVYWGAESESPADF